MPLLARLETRSETVRDRRGAPRVKLRLGVVVGSTGSRALVHDISTTGLLFETATELADDLVEVQLPHVSTAQARVVWRHGRFLGCEFTDPIPGSAVSAALLRSEHPVVGHGHSELGEAAAEPGQRAAIASRPRLAPRLKGVAALALLASGAAYLIETGRIALVVTIAGILAALAALLAVVASWALDHAKPM